ncbi:MAG TPA: chloride channel protein [Pseudoflavonifractor sp.]|nr:chloride channel protein [Pseudoflavonifractor sp.]
MLKKRILAYRNMLLLGLIAVPIGAVVGVLDAVFGRILLQLTNFRMTHAFWVIPFLGLAGVGIVWCYQKVGGKSSRGMTLIFEAGHGIADDVPLRLIPMAIVGTWLTHLFGGSAGREGVAIQIGGTLAHGIGKRLPIQNAGKLLLITGMAAGFSGLFRTPIAATFFAIEVLTAGVLEYRAIFPAMAAAFAASFTSGQLGLEKFTFALTDRVTFSWLLAARLLLLGLVFGVIGGLFALSLHKIKALLEKALQNPILRILLLGIGVSVLSLLCWGGRYSGLGTNLISMSFETGVFPWDFALKFLFTVITLSAGFQGGEVTPLFAIGAALGAVLGPLLGLPAAFVAALGYAAVFGGATNTLLAPILIGAEVFGFDYLPFFFVVCALAYLCNGNLSIYPLQKGR